MEKRWYESKTLWVNAVAIVAIVAQGVTGHEVINVEAQGAILGVINFILRLVTNTAVTK